MTAPLGRRELRRLGRDVVLNRFVASAVVPGTVRWRLLRVLGMQVERSAIHADAWFGGRDIAVGVDTFINYGCWFDNAAPIRIGARCNVGYRVVFCTSTHAPGTAERRAGRAIGLPVVVEDGCWIGACATILPGVTIGKGSVVAAGAVVTRDCAPNGLYAGVPARRVRDLD